MFQAHLNIPRTSRQGSARLGGLRQPPVSAHPPITAEGFASWQQLSLLSKAPRPEPAGPRPPQAAGRCEETRWAASGSGSAWCCGAVPGVGQDAGSRWLRGCGAGGMSPQPPVPGSRPASRQGCCRAQQQGPHAQAVGRGHHCIGPQRCSRARSHGLTPARSTARHHTTGTGEQEGTAAPKPYRSHLCVRQKPVYGLLPGRRRNDFVSSAVLRALQMPQLTINNKPRASRSQPRSQQLSRCFLSASQLSIRYMCIYEIL